MNAGTELSLRRSREKEAQPGEGSAAGRRKRIREKEAHPERRNRSQKTEASDAEKGTNR
ncbi:hypothetical protein [[Clostridium] aminophilum]|uniref:hypothetical protein n=1 Tax=[Clostridium] aminophilum TaxID=1526 RepID=UPI0015A5CCFB|nr:hypothetical protein [[Clostridium] aminophilum]